MSNSRKVLFIDSQHPRLQKDLEAAGFSCDMQYGWDRVKIATELPNYIGIVIRSRIKLDKEIISKGTNLKFIARAGAGMENIDVPFAHSMGIHCLHAPEANRDAVGEHAMGMLLALLNNICRANNEVRQCHWIREGNRGYLSLQLLLAGRQWRRRVNAQFGHRSLPLHPTFICRRPLQRET